MGLEFPDEFEIRTVYAMNKRALIVDDDQSMIRILSAVLEGEQFDVVCVQAVAQAMEKLDEEKFDLVVTDVLMPGNIGVKDLFERIGALDKRTPTIVISAYWDEDSRMRQFLEDRADGCLSKPFDLNNFREMIGKVCA